jgi:hypothetical protein
MEAASLVHRRSNPRIADVDGRILERTRLLR